MKDQLKRLSTNSFLQGGIILTIANLISSAFNYLFNVLAARALGPQGYGEVTTLFSYITILSVPINVAVAIIIQKISSQSNGRYEYAAGLEKWMYLKFKKWWYISLLLIIIIPFIPTITNLSPYVGYSLIPLLIITLILSFYDAAFQGIRMFMVFAAITIFATFLKLMGSVLVTINIGNITTVIVFIFLSLVTKYILSLRMFHMKTPLKGISIPGKRIKMIVNDKQIWLTTVSLLALYVFNNIDIIFVKKVFSATDTGMYSSWSLFAKIIMYFAAPLMSISYIFFSSKDQKKNHTKTFTYSILLILLISIGSYICYALFGTVILHLFFGEKYLSILPALPLASIFGSLYLMIFFTTQYFLSQTSKYALILPIIMPFYILTLVGVGKSIRSIMYIDIFFGFMIVICYLITLVQHFSKQRVE
jgi:O-antigen/teichoic acid export membrane protein